MLFGLPIILWSNGLNFYLQSSNLVMTKFEDYPNLIEGNDVNNSSINVVLSANKLNEWDYLHHTGSYRGEDY